MNENKYDGGNPQIKDYGPNPVILNLDCLSKVNDNYRAALWTGNCMQVTLMCIPVGEDIGVEMHANVEQFIRLETGCALVKMGKCKDNLDCQKTINGNHAVIIPAGTWHNIINIGNTPLKLYSIYAPVKHPFGTIDKTKECAQD